MKYAYNHQSFLFFFYFASMRICAGINPPVQPTIIINGNVTIKIINNNSEACYNQEDKKSKNPVKSVKAEKPEDADYCYLKSNISVSSQQMPEGYTSDILKDNSYITSIKFHTTKQNWNQARKTCYYDKGFLAYPTSAKEEAEFQRLKSINKSGHIWVGIHDLFQEGDWTSILGENIKELNYVNWMPGEPNNHAAGEHCALLEDTGLNDTPCKEYRAFICKIKLKIDQFNDIELSNN